MPKRSLKGLVMRPVRVAAAIDSVVGQHASRERPNDGHADAQLESAVDQLSVVVLDIEAVGLPHAGGGVQ